MPHVILLSDSIFDNAAYVPGSPAVIDHLRRLLPPDWHATLLAVDGNVTADIAGQLVRLPEDATHLVLSVGGNDALHQTDALWELATSVLEGLKRMQQIKLRFQADYRQMLAIVLALRKPTFLCTIYDGGAEFEELGRTALTGFNDAILREAFAYALDVIDLRLVCTESDDYSPLSPIEPSVQGGGKIARAIVAALPIDVGGRASRVTGSFAD